MGKLGAQLACKRILLRPSFAHTSLERRPSMHHWFLRIGVLGEIHRANSAIPLDRGQRVIVRTPRGVEIAEVVGVSDASRHRPAGGGMASEQPAAVSVIRRTTEQDELLIRRLERHKRRAVEECRNALDSAGSKAILLDVDQLFDGGALVMHFLGDAQEKDHQIAQQIAGKYESIIQSRHFAKLLNEGCGPGCGTSDGKGCSGSCGSCAVGCAASGLKN